MNRYDADEQKNDKYSLRGRVFNTIREDILSGKYRQKEELKEATIGAELGVSRTPVREALRQLELEGLVKIIPNKGAYVTGITKKDVRDIYTIRSLLEGLCAKWAIDGISKEQIEYLEEIIFLFEFHCNKEHYDQLLELDNEFHDIIYNASDSRMLQHTLSDFHHYVERIRKITLNSRERALKCNEEHKAILEAIISKDYELAENLANKHMMNSLDNILSHGIDNILG